MNWNLYKKRVPNWCIGFSIDEFRALQSDFEQAAQNLGYKFRVDWESGQYSEPGSNLTGGFMNLSQVWRDTDAMKRVEKIESFIKILYKWDGLQGERVEESFDEEYLDNLRIRIYPVGYLDSLAEVVSYPVVPGFIVALVRDTPEIVATVQKKRLEESDMSREAAYERARKNVFRYEEVFIDQMPLPSGEVLNFISGGTYYAATSCLALEQYLTQGNEAVFSVPNRHVLM